MKSDKLKILQLDTVVCCTLLIFLFNSIYQCEKQLGLACALCAFEMQRRFTFTCNTKTGNV